MTLLRRMAVTTGTLLLTGAVVVPAAQAVDPDLTPPVALTGLTGFGYDGNAGLSWTRPAEPDYDHALVRLAPGLTPPATTADGLLASETAVTGALLALDLGQSFAFSIWPVDTSGNVGPRSALVMRGTDVAAGFTRPAIVAGQTSTLVTRLRIVESGTVMPNKKVYLYARDNGSRPWLFLQESTTDVNGLVTVPLQPAASLQVQVRFFGAQGAIGSQVGPITLRVVPQLALYGPTQARPIKTTTALEVYGSPRTEGTPIALQKYVSGRWVTALNRRLDSAAGFTFAVPTGAAHRAITYWRVVSSATALHAARASNVIAVRTT
jgi:hypothetical protein